MENNVIIIDCDGCGKQTIWVYPELSALGHCIHCGSRYLALAEKTTPQDHFRKFNGVTKV